MNVRHLKISQKLAILFSGLFVMLVLHYFLVFKLDSNILDDGTKLDIAQRNGMSIQQAIFYLRNVVNGNQQTDLNDLNNRVHSINSNLEILQNGGVYKARFDEEIEVEPVSEDIKNQLTAFQRLWREFDKRFTKIRTTSQLHHDSVLVYYVPERAVSSDSQLPIEEDLFSLGDIGNIDGDLGSDLGNLSLTFNNSFKENDANATLSINYRRMEYQFDNVLSGNIVPDVNYIIRNAEKLVLLNKNLENSLSTRLHYDQVRLRYWMIALFLINAIVIGLGFWFVVKTSLHPLLKIRRLINRLSAGDISRTLLASSHDEVGSLIQDLSRFSQGLEKITDFATQVGKGNFDQEFEVRSKKDSLGYALLEMRNDLKQNAEEDKRRNWANEGTAKFSDILRQHAQDMQALSYQLISNLVHYLGANQGGIYSLEREGDSEDAKANLVLKAAYAYNQQKFIKQSIPAEQGLLGQAVMEKGYLYFNQISPDYIRLTSGLGEATPSYLLIVPLISNDEVHGVIELASFKVIEEYQLAFVIKLSESIAATLANVRSNERTKILLQESQMYAEQMRAQEEEMRQSMEELTTTQEELERIQGDLRERLTNYEAVVNSTKSMILALDGEYNIKVLNRSYAAMLRRLKGTEVPNGSNILEILSQEQLEYWKPYYERALGGETFTMVSNIKNSEFEDLYYELEFFPLIATSGDITGFAIVNREVTSLNPIRFTEYEDIIPIE
ncbi:GAF domain-containing protein [Bernardetia sp.]|uniref:GAF domain-containing protein n=1 Tax=Bernardetia sp. TaxID=1937974 RepID=UPI0025B8A764|nr:GAF domain-containing protein [Bernardetia sp.]